MTAEKRDYLSPYWRSIVTRDRMLPLKLTEAEKRRLSGEEARAISKAKAEDLAQSKAIQERFAVTRGLK
jgi:hypothetical protein